MNKLKMMVATTGFVLLATSAQAGPRTVRATDMAPSMWSDLAEGRLGDMVIEFRQNDELPVSFEAQGDLLETRRTSVSYVGIKKNFWLRLSQNDVEISFDGASFKKLNESLTGSIEAGAGTGQAGGVANAINIVFKAFLK